MPLKSDSFLPPVATTTNVSKWLYCPNNAQPRSGRLWISNADGWPQRSDVKDKSDFPAVWTVCVLGSVGARGWMCTQCLLLLPPCKRVGDADYASNIKTCMKWIFTHLSEVEEIHRNMWALLVLEEGICCNLKVIHTRLDMFFFFYRKCFSVTLICS